MKNIFLGHPEVIHFLFLELRRQVKVNGMTFFNFTFSQVNQGVWVLIEFFNPPKKNLYLWAQRGNPSFFRPSKGYYRLHGNGCVHGRRNLRNLRLDMTLLEFLKWNNYKGHRQPLDGWMVWFFVRDFSWKEVASKGLDDLMK